MVCSALSSVGDALDEPMHEEINHLITLKREDLPNSTGMCLCLPLLGHLVVSYPLANLLQTFQWPNKDTHFPEKSSSPSEGSSDSLGRGQLSKNPVIVFVGTWEHKSRPPRAELDRQWGTEISPDVISCELRT